MTNSLERTGRDAVSQNVQGIVQFLQQHPPFSQMEPGHLVQLVEGCRLAFYPQGSRILHPGDGRVQEWFLIRQGQVRGERGGADVPASEGLDTAELELWPGDGFPVAAIVGDRSTRTTYTAVQDTFCLQLPVQQYAHMLQLSEPFRQFAFKGVSSLLGQLHLKVQQSATVSLGAQYSLDARLQTLMGREPLTCSPDTTVQAAVQQMYQRRVGSVAVVDAQQHLLGIFTLRDLRNMVAQGQPMQSSLMADCMVPNPYSLPSSSTAFDAALLLTQHHITHVCVVDDGKLVGVLSERDLFALQRVDLVHLARALRQADSIEALQAQRRGIDRLVDAMLAHGASAAQILRVITQLNDHTTTRVIELMLAEHGDPGVPFTWLVFGSEGRQEQTLLTDQDNGILFQADSVQEAEQHRQRLLPLARAINQALHQCGLTLCKGNIMAGNPRLCLSAREWHGFFLAILRETDPENLLKATIFFDIRPLWGADNGFAHLQAELLAMVADNPLFQRMMAQTALEHSPTLGGVRNRLEQALGLAKADIDLKTQALTPFVDGARILALAHGITEASTLERMAQLAQKGVIGQPQAQAWSEAYNYLQLLRMQQHRRQAQADQPLDNSLNPASLNTLDERILRESLRQARQVQDSLRLRYRLS